CPQQAVAAASRDSERDLRIVLRGCCVPCADYASCERYFVVGRLVSVRGDRAGDDPAGGGVASPAGSACHVRAAGFVPDALPGTAVLQRSDPSSSQWISPGLSRAAISEACAWAAVVHALL